MKEIQEILEAYDAIDKNSVKLAIATVIEVKGSSYRRTGARMLIQDNGIWTGGISGGCIEGNALKKANMAILEEKARLVTYDTEKEDEEEIGVTLGCNGIITVLISPIDTESVQNPIEKLRQLVNNYKPQLLITVVSSQNNNLAAGYTYTTNEIDQLWTEISDHSRKFLSEGLEMVESTAKSSRIQLENLDLFIEFLPPPIHLVICGGNYDILSLMGSAKQLGWRITIVNNPRRLSTSMKALAGSIFEDLNEVHVDNYSAVIIMSHDYNADFSNLKKAVQHKPSYIGLLGPAIRTEKMLRELEENHITYDKDLIFGPTGLDIGARQPEEIACSITAEILAIYRNRDGMSLRKRKEPINERN